MSQPVSRESNALREHVVLVVPARAEMWGVVRMTASALAARLDYSFEGIEDLRLAVTEVCGWSALGATTDATCECRFDVSADRFEMYCAVGPVTEAQPDSDHRFVNTLEFSQQILRATVDSYVIDPVDGGLRRGYLCKDRGSVALR